MTDPRQTLMFITPGKPVDRLWSAWLATSEAGRWRFLERIRAEFLGAAQKARRQAGPDGQRVAVIQKGPNNRLVERNRS